MNTNPSKPVGFRPTQPFGDGTAGWRLWIGPLLIARAHTRFGLTVGWTR